MRAVEDGFHEALHGGSSSSIPMSLVRWREQFETGLESIDAQHRQLFEALARLAEALGGSVSRERLEEELAFVARHLIKHCQTEETLMREAGFPERIAHANQHQDLVRHMRDLQYQHTKGQTPSLELLSGIGEELDRHICGSDRALAGYLKALHPA